jgi:hypothetical protein
MILLIFFARLALWKTTRTLTLSENKLLRAILKALVNVVENNKHFAVDQK